MKLPKDPGLYSVWNLAIKIASSDYITNANVDDRRTINSLEMHANALDNLLNVDLVYSSYVWSNIANQTYDEIGYKILSNVPEFFPKNMWGCLPGPQPMWRKSLHDKYGFFDEALQFVGDYEMWLRAVSKGSIFKKIEGVSGVFYENPEGLTRNFDHRRRRLFEKENVMVVEKYRYLWQ